VAGANGFAPKPGPVEELVAVLRSARPGRISVAPSMLVASQVR
jgi:DNA-binding NarL/FixJ family response regulator